MNNPCAAKKHWWFDKDDERHQRVWFPDPPSPELPGAYVLLVRAPLTLGHSQLVVAREGEKEANVFRRASASIEMAMRRFAMVFENDRAHEEPEFGCLAAFTQTAGSFERTLVLRASASEDATEYKVHLVPYFQSHANLCALRYMQENTRHGSKCVDGHVEPNRGGLLAWLGERESAADMLETGIAATTKSQPVKDWWYQDLIRSFDLPQLARRLKRGAPS